MSLAERLQEEWAAVVDPTSWAIDPSDWRERDIDPAAPVPARRAWADISRDLLENLGGGDVRYVFSAPRWYRHVISAPQAPTIADRFQELVAQWKRETIIDSSVQRRVMHPAYQHIIGLGPDALPLILDELEREPDYWFWALTAITGEDPARDETTLAGARQRWLDWADERRL